MGVPQTELRAAYAECRRLASRHYENFPTASYLVPLDRRDALAAIYAFARYADDVADEPGVEGRLEKLADWRSKLEDCYAGQAEHPVFVALQDSARRFRLSQQNFENLLRAFESDVRVNRHPNFDSLLAYCTCSANPVGRLVLELFDHRDPHLFELSDHICTALQLTNFWQDVAVDFARDRVYLPQEDMARFGYTLDDAAGPACRPSLAGAVGAGNRAHPRSFRKGARFAGTSAARTARAVASDLSRWNGHSDQNRSRVL